MSLSQTSCLALLKGMDCLGKLYGGDVAATLFYMIRVEMYQFWFEFF